MNYVALAQVLKTHSRFGEVVCQSADDLSTCLKEGMRVALVPPELKLSRWHTIARVEAYKNNYLVAFADVDDLSLASNLVGKTMLVSEEELKNTSYATHAQSLLGRSVTDCELGFLGRISKIEKHTLQDLWTITGPFGELLVPAAQDLILSLEEESISVRIPKGLLSLTEKSSR